MRVSELPSFLTRANQPLSPALGREDTTTPKSVAGSTPQPTTRGFAGGQSTVPVAQVDGPMLKFAVGPHLEAPQHPEAQCERKLGERLHSAHHGGFPSAFRAALSDHVQATVWNMQSPPTIHIVTSIVIPMPPVLFCDA